MGRGKMAVATGWVIEMDKMDVPTVIGNPFFFLPVLSIEPRVSHKLSKYSVTEL